ncbi:MAG TPA: TspO/MBR family protein [Candidatus Paceibacterota bacterium]|nr:TspO/MBR family protein [Candidatus Paceibacterota bacterium]
MNLKEIGKLLVALIVAEAAGIIGALFTTPAISTWYAPLVKAPLNPPSWVFGPVWTTLYALLGIALYIVWHNGWRVRNQIVKAKKRAWNRWSEQFWVGDWQKQNIIAVFAVQWILNVGWSIIFFGLHQPGWAFFEIIALWISIVYVMVNFYRVSKAAAWILLPYLVWVSFAAYLN